MPAAEPTRLVLNHETYEAVLQGIIPAAKKVLWLVTADLKDLYTSDGGNFVPLLQILAEKLDEGVEIRLVHAKEPGPWLEQLKARRPANVVIVAQAAKMARAIWAVTAKQEDYQRGYRSVRPQAA